MYGIATMGVITIGGVVLMIAYPPTTVYVTAMIKTGALTFIIQKAVKLAGKEDFSDIIKLAGWSLCGVQIINIVKYVIDNPPAWWKTLKNLDTGIGSIVKMLGGH
jgi:FtsH-binding integral membrane protein